MRDFIRIMLIPVIVCACMSLFVCTVLLAFMLFPATRVDRNNYFHNFSRTDSLWYIKIADSGYIDATSADHHKSVVFFPLYPLLIRLGQQAIPNNTYLSYFILNELCLFTDAILFYALSLFVLQNTKAAFYGLLFFFMLPFSVFLFADYTESLFLLCILAVFLLLEKKQFFYASVVTGISTALRAPALILPCVYVFSILSTKQCTKRSLVKLCYLPLCFTGILAYSGYVHSLFVFIEAEKAWHRPGFSIKNFIRQLQVLVSPQIYIAAGISHTSLKTFYYIRQYLDDFFLVIPLAAVPWVRIRMGWKYALYIVLYVFIMLSLSDPLGTSNGRYSLALFPVPMALGFLASKYIQARLLVLISLILFTVLLFFFFNKYPLY